MVRPQAEQNFAFYRPVLEPDASGTSADFAPDGPLTAGLICRLFAIALRDPPLHPGARYARAQAIDRCGGESAAYWAFALGILRAETNGGDAVHYTVSTREHLAHRNDRAIVQESAHGRLWYCHWALAANRRNPIAAQVINDLLLHPTDPCALDAQTIAGIVCRRATDDPTPEVERTRQAQAYWLARRMQEGALRALGLTGTEIPLKPRALPKKLVFFAIAHRVWEHVARVRRERIQMLFACSPTNFPIAALWIPGNPAAIFRLSQIAVWDTLLDNVGDPLRNGTILHSGDAYLAAGGRLPDLSPCEQFPDLATTAVDPLADYAYELGTSVDALTAQLRASVLSVFNSYRHPEGAFFKLTLARKAGEAVPFRLPKRFFTL